MRFKLVRWLSRPGEYDGFPLKFFSIARKRESLFMPRALRFSALLLCSLFPLAGLNQAAAGQATAGQATAGQATQVQPAPASAPPAPSAPAPPTPAAATPGEIHLNVVVTDRSGKPVAGLTAADFTVLDNNQPSKILSFAAYDAPASLPPNPVQVIILFDTVNADFNTVSYTRQQVSSFLRRNGGHLAQPVTLAFLTNTNIDPQGPPSLDGNALASALDSSSSRLRTIGNSAGAYGAIERMEISSRLLDDLLHNETPVPGRKLLIWASPGWPMLDSPSINISLKGQQSIFASIVRLNTELRQAQVDLYSVSQGMPTSETFVYQSFLKGVKKVTQAQIPDVNLKVLAVQSGGLALAPTNDVASSLDTCIRDAATYYSISFAPPPADGPDEYHKLDLRLDKPGLTARTNASYYNQPAGAEDRVPAGR
jgi:VWFA-related protein